MLKAAPSNLVLGTAQLGMPYGIANKKGQPDTDTSLSIIREAWENGIREFDTAQGYGNSEEVLGKAIMALGIKNDVRVISKFDPALNHLNKTDMDKAVEGSLSKLGIPFFHGLMLHHEDLLDSWNYGLNRILHSLVLEGKVSHIGVSVYSPQKAIEALNIPEIELIQVPTNILDRRFENAGVFKLALKLNKRIYIRSVFLQGLILLPSDEISSRISHAKLIVNEIEHLCAELGLTRHQIALGYLKLEMSNVGVLFGAENPEQVKQNVQIWEQDYSQRIISIIKDRFIDVDEKILNPTYW